MPDNRLLLEPVSLSDLESALASLRTWPPLFKGVRGTRPLDVQALYGAVRAVAKLLEDDNTFSVEINPLIVTEEGATAVDALIEVRA